MRRVSSAMGVCVLTVLLGCAAALPMATEQDARVAGVPLPDLHEGRERYVAKCSGCHRLYAPADYDDNEWTVHVPAMRQKARLSDSDIVAILGYVTAVNGTSAAPLARAPER